jgi:hypothetical protein
MRYWIWSFVGLSTLLALAIIVPNLVPPRTVLSQSACVANLKYIQQLKEDWARRNHSGSNAVPASSDLFPREPDMPACPAGGVYRVGAVSEKPTCSIGPPVHCL